MKLILKAEMHVIIDRSRQHLEAGWRIRDEIMAMYEEEKKAMQAKVLNRIKNYLKQLEDNNH